MFLCFYVDAHIDIHKSQKLEEKQFFVLCSISVSDGEASGLHLMGRVFHGDRGSLSAAQQRPQSGFFSITFQGGNLGGNVCISVFFEGNNNTSSFTM